MPTRPIVLVPGFWLGAWAWDEVVESLRSLGHSARALTLPGLDSIDTDRASISFADHVDAICQAVESAGPPAILAVHSGAGAPGYAATDRIPENVARMVYVDTGPAKGPLDPEFDSDELPLPSPEQLAEDENLDGLTDQLLARFRDRAIPQPGAALRESAELTNNARLDVPTTLICTAFTSEQYREAADAGYPFLAGLNELTDVTYVDLPTGHWPMWSRPADLAEVLAGLASA